MIRPHADTATRATTSTTDGRPAAHWRRRHGVLAVFAVTLAVLPGAAAAVSDSAVAAVESPAIRGTRPTVSEDGRIVAFVATRNDEATGTTAHLRDRARSTTVDVLPSGEGRRPGDTAFAVVSSDGCSMTVLTQVALDLFDDDDEGERWDVYRAAAPKCDWRDVSALEWELVSADGDGRARNDVDAAQAPSVSATGTVVAYVVPTARRSRLGQVLVTDLTVAAGAVGRTVPVPGLPAEAPADGVGHVGQVEPAISGDGELVVFTSDATASRAVPSWSSANDAAVTGVFAWNRAQGATVEVSTGAIRRGAKGSASQPSVSFDGSTVAFVATNGRNSPRPTTTQVYVHHSDANGDRVGDDPATELVSRSLADGGRTVLGGNAPSWRPSLSSDGTTVAFMTRATDMLPSRVPFASASDDGHTTSDVTGDVMIADLAHGKLRRASSEPNTAAAHSSVSLSASGRVAVFDSASPTESSERPLTDRHVVVESFPAEVSMPAIDVGTTFADWPSPEWYLTVSNTGSSTFLPRVVRTTDAQFVVAGGSCVGARVVPGGSCTVRVVFIPADDSDALAELIVAETGFEPVVVSTLLLGSVGEPTLSASPAGLGFPDTAVGNSSAPASIELRNVGLSPVEVEGVAMSGDHPDDMRVESNDCTDRTLFPDETCRVEVVFAPTEAGMRSALVTFTTKSTPTRGRSRTSALVSGVAEHRPDVVSMERVRAGRPVDVLAWGYPPGAEMVVSWLDHRGSSVTVITDDRGELVARLQIHPRQPPGRRTIVVSDPTGRLPSTTWSVMVRPGR